jgi:hypothetical protein
MKSLREVISEVKNEPLVGLKNITPEAKALYESQRTNWGPLIWGMPVESGIAAVNKAAKKGIPTRPVALFSEWKEFFQGMLVFLGFFLLFAITSIFIFNSPRSY